MAYTDIDDPTIYFNTVLYTSNSGSSPRTISGVGFQPDWVWVKNRDSGDYNHVASDSVRGLNKILQPDTTIAQLTNHAAGYISAANSDGFVLTAGSSNLSNYDTGSNKQVAWNWKAGTSFTNDASSTSVGDIDSAGSVNTDAGFSIISFTKTDGEVTVAHGLGAKPSLIIFKPLASANWIVTATINNSMSNNYLLLHASDANQTDGAYANPTSSVFSISNNIAPNSAHIAYCFAPKQGYSRVGTFLSNNTTDNAWVYCGFKPALVLLKSTTSTNDWMIFDNKRDPFNVTQHKIYPDLSNAEATNENDLDFLSTGFKLRNNHGANTFIFMAFAEQPFVTSKGVPATAR